VGRNQKDIIERDALEDNLGFHRGMMRPRATPVNTPSENREAVPVDGSFG
jgi:hypothetical protein